MKIGGIELAGFKSIRLLRLELRDLNVFIGANGSGKSNFISAFRLLNYIAESRLQEVVGRSGGADTFLYFGQKTTEELRIELTFKPPEVTSYLHHGYRIGLRASAGDRLVFHRENIITYAGPGQVITRELGSGRTESALPDVAAQKPEQLEDFILKALKSPQIYHFNDTSGSASIKKTWDVGEHLQLRSDGGNLAAFLYHLSRKAPQHYLQIRDTVRLIAPFFDDFELNPEGSEHIQLRWRANGADYPFLADQLSDGTLRFMCLATLLLQPSTSTPDTIIIDEPELGLHPYAIVVLAGLLRSATAEKTQIIVATQSVTLIDHLSLPDLIVVDYADRQSTFRRLDADKLKDWMEDYTLGELWEKNVLGGRP